MQLGKWIALHEAFGKRRPESYSTPRNPFDGEPELVVCQPAHIQLLEGGALRIVFAVHREAFPCMKPWVEVVEVVDSGRGVLATTRVPSFAYESCGMGAGRPLPVPDCAWCLAEIVLTVLDKFATVGARDPGTLQDLFGHYFGTNAACRPGWDDNYGPLPGSRRLNEVQFASILQLSDQYRAKFGSDATSCTFAYRYGSGSGDALQRVRSLAALATALPPPLPPLPPP